MCGSWECCSQIRCVVVGHEQRPRPRSRERQRDTDRQTDRLIWMFNARSAAKVIYCIKRYKITSVIDYPFHASFTVGRCTASNEA